MLVIHLLFTTPDISNNDILVIVPCVSRSVQASECMDKYVARFAIHPNTYVLHVNEVRRKELESWQIFEWILFIADPKLTNYISLFNYVSSYCCVA